MELPILNSILHGELRPGQIDISNKKRFAAWVKTANAVSPATCDELQKQLSALLADFSATQKKVNATLSLKVKLQPLLYEPDAPPPTDVITQFYSLLIERETLRVSNLLIQQVASLPDDIDRRYNITLAFKSVKALAGKAAAELRESGFTTSPDASSPLEHFVFFTLKQTLAALFFEIQERFKDLLPPTETEQTFCDTVLQESYSGTLLKPTTAYYEFHMQRLIPENKFSESHARDLLKQIPQFAKFANLQAALENMIFLRSNNHASTPLTIDQLANQDFAKQHFTTAKETLSREMNQQTTGYERLEVAETALDALDYIQPAPVNRLSIPQRLYLWLQDKKALYTTTASQIYTVESDTEQELRKASKPLSKKSQTSATAQKQVAHEHLKFMSGFNRMNQRIMPDNDFQKLISAVSALIETGKVPGNTKPIPQIGLKTNFIRYTFYKLHEQLFTTQKIKPEWIDFLHAFFAQFKNTKKSTTKAKFAEPPKSYATDLQAMTKVI